MSGHNTPSPTGSGPGALEAGVNGNADQPAPRDVFATETEVQAPSKEEIETNEKNLQQNAAYLGQLVFKLR